MEPVTCSRCGTTVEVSKASAAQTSIQWYGDSSSCPLRSDLAVGDTCPSLSESIRDAVLRGEVAVPSEL